ncbi:MAG: hypothetical protein HY741_03830 [Chloroflexi bacterium]|nr:hypothetical protein [Chloroflexota bacterium]
MLKEVAENVDVISHSRFLHLDLERNYVDNSGSRARKRQDRIDSHATLKKRLTSFLYARYYNGSFTFRSSNQSVPRFIFGYDPKLVYALDQANNGQGYFEKGWCVTDSDGADYLTVNNGKITLRICRALHLSPSQQQAQVGDVVAIRWPSGRPFASPGFYLATSDFPFDSESSNIARLYFNIQIQSADSLMRAMTTVLNQAPIGFRFKICSNPHNYARWDVAVLYFDHDDFMLVRDKAVAIYKNLQASFNPQVPAFTKLLAPGLALAEEPPQTTEQLESFGEHRCRLLAEGLLNAFEKSCRDPIGKLKLMIERFHEEGLNLDYPYLNPGNKDIYHWD